MTPGFYHAPHTKLNSGSPSAKQYRNLCSRSPSLYQDLSACHDWPVQEAFVDMPIKMKGNSKRTSGNSLSPLGAQNNGIGAAAQTSLTDVKLRLRRRLLGSLCTDVPQPSGKIGTSVHRLATGLKALTMFTIFYCWQISMNAGIIPEYALISIPIQSVPTSMEVTVVIVIEVIWRITIQACLRESSLTVQVRIIFPC